MKNRRKTITAFILMITVVLSSCSEQDREARKQKILESVYDEYGITTAVETSVSNDDTTTNADISVSESYQTSVDDSIAITDITTDDTISTESQPIVVNLDHVGSYYEILNNGNILSYDVDRFGNYPYFCLIDSSGNVLLSDYTDDFKTITNDLFYYANRIYNSDGKVVINPVEIGFDGYVAFFEDFSVVYKVDRTKDDNNLYIGVISYDGDWIKSLSNEIKLFDYDIKSIDLTKGNIKTSNEYSDSSYLVLNTNQGFVIYDVNKDIVVYDYFSDGQSNYCSDDNEWYISGDNIIQITESAVNKYNHNNDVECLYKSEDVFAIGDTATPVQTYSNGRFVSSGLIFFDGKDAGIYDLNHSCVIPMKNSKDVYGVKCFGNNIIYIGKDVYDDCRYLYFRNKDEYLCDPVKIDGACEIKNGYVIAQNATNAFIYYIDSGVKMMSISKDDSCDKLIGYDFNTGNYYIGYYIDKHGFHIVDGGYGIINYVIEIHKYDYFQNIITLPRS